MENFAEWLGVATDALVFGLIGTTMVVSLLGLIIPIFPGGVVMWLAGLAYGLYFGFGWVGWIIFAFMTMLMIAIGLADNVLMGAKAREQGASWWSIGLGLLGGLLGSLLIPPQPFGGFLMAPLTVFLVEYWRLKDHEKAWKVTRGLLIGFGQAFFVRFGLGVIMLVFWGIWVISKIPR